MIDPSRILRDRGAWLAARGALAVEVPRALRRVTRENFPVLFVSVAYFTAARVGQMLLGAPVAQLSLRYPGSGMIYLYLLFIAAGVMWADFRRQPRGELGGAVLDRAAMFGLTLLVIPFALRTYAGWKLAIPVLQPFAWDAHLARFDRMLHLGHDPWRLLQPVVGHPWATWWLDYVYLLWFPVTAFTLVWQACSGNRLERARYLLAFVLGYVSLGTAAALAFSSAGPCYYRFVAAGPDPYAGLMAYLARVDAATPLVVLEGQAALWRNYATSSGTDFLGISAMPSMHLALVTLATLAAWRTNRAAGAALGIFTVLVLVASVHLGWHYAIDGYAAIAGTGFIWWLCGALLRRYFVAAGVPVAE